jgi:hypothetical protein
MGKRLELLNSGQLERAKYAQSKRRIDNFNRKRGRFAADGAMRDERRCQRSTMGDWSVAARRMLVYANTPEHVVPAKAGTHTEFE